MKHFALLFALIPLIAFAAPVPRQAKFTVAGWGEPVDPLADCSFDVDRDGRLTLSVPGLPRDLSAHWGKMNAPRVLREIEGDFQIQVALQGDWPLTAKPALRSRGAFFGAGLFLAEDDKNYIRLEKAQWDSEGKPGRVTFDLWKNGEWIRSDGRIIGELDGTKPGWLRLIRKGDSVSAARSQDGKTWSEPRSLDAKFGRTLKVGIAAYHYTDTAFKTTFSDLKIQNLEAAKP